MAAKKDNITRVQSLVKVAEDYKKKDNAARVLSLVKVAEDYKNRQENQLRINRQREEELKRRQLEDERRRLAATTPAEVYESNFKGTNTKVTPKTYNNYLTDFNSARNSGAFDSGKDWTKWSADKISSTIEELTNHLNNLEQKRNAAGKIEARKQELEDLWRQEGAYKGIDNLDDVLWSYELGGDLRISKRPDDYNTGNNRENYDKALYDHLHGDGAYAQRVEALNTDADVDALEQEMDDLWTRFENKTLYQIPDQDEKLQREKKENKQIILGDPESEKLLKNLQEAQRNYNQVKDFETAANQIILPDNVQRPAQNVLTDPWTMWKKEYTEYNGLNGASMFYADYKGNDADTLYTWVHSGEEERRNLNRQLTLDEAKAWSKYWLMDPVQVKTFDDYYLSGDKKGAVAYLEALSQYYLDPAKADMEQLIARQEAEGPLGALYGVQSIIERPVTAITGSIGTVLGLLGVESAQNPKSGWYQGQAINDAIRAGRNFAWGENAEALLGSWAKEPAKFLNSVFYSMADMGVAMGLSSIGGAAFGSGFVQPAVQFIMSSEAASSTMTEQLEKNRDPREAALYAIGSGAIEWITEKYSVEALLKPNVKEMLGNKGQIAKYIAKNFVAEGSEEGAADILNLGLDAALSTLYGHQNEIEDRRDEILAANPGMKPEDALNQAWIEQLEQTGLSMLAGGVSGLGMAGGNVAFNKISQHRTGKNIRTGSNVTAEGKNGLEQVIELGRGMKEGTESRALAEKLQEKTEKGKEPTNAEVGRLAQLVTLESGEQQGELVKDTIRRNVESQLTKSGVSPKYVKQYAGIITDSLTNGGTLTKENQQILAQSEAAINVWKSFHTYSEETRQLIKEVSEATKEARNTIRSIDELSNRAGGTFSVIGDEVAQSVRETKNQSEAVDNLLKRRGELISEDYAKLAKEILETEGKQNDSRFLDDAMKIRLAAMTLAPSAPKTGISAEGAQQLFDQARKEFDKAEENRIQSYTTAKPGEGVATFNGAEYGTAAWRRATEGLNKNLWNQMGAIGEVAARMGLRVNFINDTEHESIFGQEDNETGAITINIAGRSSKTGLSHHMLVTLSHEMTHWLEQNSKEGYAQLRQYVLDSLRSKGESIEKLVANTIDSHNMILGTEKGLSINGAVAEVVARSCENLLSSKAFANEIAKTNPSLYSKIKTYVKNFMARLRNAVAGMNESLSREAIALLNETEKIAEIWLGAREEAMGRKIQGPTLTLDEAMASPVVVFSLEQLDDGTKYVKLDTDQEIFDNADIDEYPSIVEKYITKRFRGRVIGNANRAYVDRRAAKEYARPANHRISDEMYEAKARTATELDILLDAAEFVENKDDDKRHKEAVGGWDYYKSIVYVPRINKFYEGIISIEKVAKGDRFHDFGKLKDVTRAMQGHNASLAPDDVSENNIPENGRNGKSHSLEQTAEALQQDLELKNGPETHYGDHQQFSVEVKDPEELAFLNNQKTVITYKTMQLINGKLYPPMAAVVAGSMEDASQLGHWEKATEHPELIKAGNQFTLNKGNKKGSINAAYNPYMHSSNLMINDQFSGAYDRPNLVTVECEVPVSELDSGYHAEFAKDSVGWHSWHTGTVAGQLRKQKGVERQVMLSRWIKPVRIVPDAEVAAHYKEMIDGTDIQVPDNVVPPALLEELRKAGVPIKESGRVQFSVEQLDQEYQEAVESGNLDRATEMLMDRLAETEGIIPFNAPHGYSGQHRDIAKLIKEGTPEAVARAAADMARFVPENGVLIPMPPHEGTVETDTDTMILANAISKLTGRPVVVALESDPRESRYQAKSEGRKGVTAAEMGFRQVKDIPEGTMPIFVDNVVGSGVTADAARTAMGGGITLAYAKGTQSKGIEGLKRATVTYDKDGKLIPLSQRFDRSIRNVNYSMEQLDEEYEAARKAGDEDTMRRLVNEAANRAMKDSVARYDDETLIPVMHGTNEEFNIFDTSKHGGDHGTAEGFGIYLTDGPEVSEKYGKRQISGFFNAKRLAHGNEVTIKARELTDVIRATCEEQAREIAEEEGYDNWQDALRDTWISNYIYTPDYKNMNAAYRAVADQILQQTDNDNDIIREVMAGMGIREYDQAMDFYHRILTPITGIDGMWTEWKNYEDETIANIFLAFNSNQIKSADLVTYDDQGKVIPLSQRFNPENPDIRYSVEQGDNPQPITNDRGEEIAVLLPGNTVAATQFSLDSYYELGERKKMMDQLKKAGYTEKQIKKWIGDLDNIAAIIAGDRVRYDFVADRSKKFLKPNGDVYKKTLDASTMCKKTRLYNGTFNLVQHMMPHTIFMPEDLIDLFNIMKDENLETPCGFCYVQSRRRQLGPYTKEWLEKYKGEYIPTVDEVTTSDGLEKLKVEHPQTYKDFVAAMNKKGVNNPKLVQQRTDYRGDIRKLSKSTIEYLKAIGGLRIQSFSDFEVVHMLDMMQAVMDMKAVGLTAQAYTKVPEFAWIFGRTGIKINLSLVGKGTGLDADGNLVFDNDEGIDFNEAMKLREAYTKNVGTILVGINDDHIIAAMGDDRIDFIIPFHKSGWSKAELDRMRGLSAYQDYTETQNEYQWTINEDGERVLVKADSNIDPLSYWNFKQDGTWNAERYLQECKKQGLVPKFSQFLVKNADGSYSLPQGNSQRDQNIRKGYWKTLIDFKMYDNDGVGAEQMPVEPNFNMEKAFEILKEYDGSHRQLPEDMKAAKKFVRNFKRTHPLDDVRTQYSMEQAPDMDVQAWMAGLTPGSLQTEDERALLQAWKDKRMSISLSIKRQLDYRAKIKRLENSADSLTPQEREDLVALRNKLQVQEEKQARLEKEMYQITSQEGFAGMMYQQNMVMRDFITGRTQDEINDTVDDMVHEVQRMAREIAATRKELEKLAEAEDLRNAQKALDGTDLNRNARRLKKDYRSRMTENEIQARLAEMALRLAGGESVEDVAESARELAYDLGRLQNGYLGGAYGDLADRLKQVTIVIGQTQREQLAAQHSSIPQLRRQLAGSGVKIVFDPNLRGAGTLEDIGPGSEIHDLIPELGEDTGNMMNNLDVFVGLVQSTLKNLENEMLHDFDLDDAAMMIQGYALLASTELQGDPAMTTQVKRMLGLAKGEGGKAGELAERLKNAQDYLKGAIDKGEQAKGLTKMLRKDVDSAINYYNKTAAVAAKVEKQKVKEGLIAQLKSEHAKALYAEQENWKELIKKDKKARETAQDNLHLRSIINTDISRIRKLIMNETDQKNIPEEAKPLARQLLKMLGTHDFVGYRKVLLMQRKDIAAMMDALNAYEKRDGGFDAEKDLRWLIIAPETEYADYDAYDQVCQDLIDIESGLVEYRTAEGQGLISLMDRNAALKKVQTAVTEIYDVIRAKQEVEINGRRMLYNELAQQARDDMKDSRYKGEWVGATKPIGAVKGAIVYGNMTPEYFFKNLKNKTISMLWDMYHKAENQSGLEIKKAKLRMAEIAEETGFESWDQEKKYSFQLARGGKVELTLGEIMSLYATWQREMLNQAEVNGPEKSYHLELGGFYVEEKTDKKAGREIRKQRAHRVTEDDMNAIKEAMTPEQLSYVNQVVGYLSNEMAELGNEASMRMFGIKKFNEEWYFPFEMWSGEKSVKSDAGVAGTQQNRVASGSGSRRRVNNARNALVIRDFTDVAVKHINWMITYNTFAPAIETMQRVMNTKLNIGEGDDVTMQNVRTAFGEAYGSDALKYYDDFQKHINGGAARVDKTPWDLLLRTFRKISVAGSLSVTLQQPLSYIRAANLINGKYLVAAMNPATWRGSKTEMEKYSGVAVIKSMGKFDMNYGESAVDYMSPQKKTGTARKVWDWIADKSTKAPEVADTVTWTRLWTACKMEQDALNPEMDKKSDEFLEKVAERFNEVMRQTQVYDSVLVKSKNMRSNNPVIRSMTSFMGEPTLSINVIADAFVNAKGSARGKLHLANAAGLFLLSAVAQAAIKALMGAARTPDEKKNKEENFLYRFEMNLLNEANIFTNIPGYSDLISLLKGEEINDDAYSVLTKLFKAAEAMEKWVSGEAGAPYRYIEDSAGVILQIFSRVPLKNIMRDARAMYNWFIDKPYANRETSAGVLRYQHKDLFYNADNMLGVINTKRGKEGYQTTNDAYYARLWNATKAGDDKAAAELEEYLTLGRGVKKDAITAGLRTAIKKDNGASIDERVKALKESGMQNYKISEWVEGEYKEGRLTKEEATKAYLLANPKEDKNDAYFAMERQDYERETGIEVGTNDYFRLDAAIEKGNEKEIAAAEKELLDHGVKKDQIESHKKRYFVKAYKSGDISRKEAEQGMKKYGNDLTDKDIYWALEEVDYEAKTHDDVGGVYYKLNAAIEKNDSAAVSAAEKELLSHGYEKEDIKKHYKSYFTDRYKDGKISRSDAEVRLKKYRPDLDAGEVFWTFDRIDFKKETGKDSGGGYYYRLTYAIDTNKADQIKSAVNLMLKHGVKAKNIKSNLPDKVKDKYLSADMQGKTRIRNALQIAFKALGYTATDADKAINNWTKPNKKK